MTIQKINLGVLKYSQGGRRSTEESGFDSLQGQEIFSSAKHTVCLRFLAMLQLCGG